MNSWVGETVERMWVYPLSLPVFIFLSLSPSLSSTLLPFPSLFCHSSTHPLRLLLTPAIYASLFLTPSTHSFTPSLSLSFSFPLSLGCFHLCKSRIICGIMQAKIRPLFPLSSPPLSACAGTRLPRQLGEGDGG